MAALRLHLMICTTICRMPYTVARCQRVKLFCNNRTGLTCSTQEIYFISENRSTEQTYKGI